MTQIQREDSRMKTDAETGVLWSQARNLVTTRSKKMQRRDSPLRASVGSMALPTLDFGILASRARKE